MKTIIAGALLLCLGVVCAERAFPLRSLAARSASANGNQNYWFLGAPRKGSNSIQAVQLPLSRGDFANDDADDEANYEQLGASSVVIQDDDDDDENSIDEENNGSNFENDSDDDDDDVGSELTSNVVGIISLDEGNAFYTNGKDNDGILEMEDKEIDNDDDDEESGGATIFLPRGALEKIPNGSILALVDDSESTGRALKRYRVRRTGLKRRRRVSTQRVRRRRRRGGNVRRRKPTIRVIRPVTNRNRVSNRRRRPNVIRL